VGEGFTATDQYLGRLCFLQKGRYIAAWANVAAGEDPVALAKALMSKLQ
jgi:hypothetical protein